MSEDGSADRREHARIAVTVNARFRRVDPGEADLLRGTLRERASIWVPSGEEALRELASRVESESVALVAQAVLELADELVRLQSRAVEPGGSWEGGEVRELSGGGGQLAARMRLEPGSLLDFRLEGGDSGTPPLRALAEVVHVQGPPPGRYGFRFDAIHPRDQDLLIRFLYLVQRRALPECRPER